RDWRVEGPAPGGERNGKGLGRGLAGRPTAVVAQRVDDDEQHGRPGGTARGQGAGGARRARGEGRGERQKGGRGADRGRLQNLLSSRARGTDSGPAAAPRRGVIVSRRSARKSAGGIPAGSAIRMLRARRGEVRSRSIRTGSTVEVG